MQRALLFLSLLTIACGSRHDAVIAQGTIEVEESDIVPTVRGRISRLWVDEGRMVHRGDTVATAEHDDLPDDRPRMDELFPATRLVTIKNAGHWVHSEQPEIFTEALRRFLERVEPAA